MHQCQSQPIKSKNGDIGKIKIARKPFLKFSKNLALILYQMAKSLKEKVIFFSVLLSTLPVQSNGNLVRPI